MINSELEIEKNSEYRILRLLDSSEVLCRIHKPDSTTTRYSQMLRIVISPNGQATMIPYVDVANFDDLMIIKDEHIVFSYIPKSDAMVDQHKKLIEILKEQLSKIIKPTKKIIMP